MDFQTKQNIFDGLIVDELRHIQEISCYNNNFYIYKNKIIFGKSDDDTQTEWFLVDYNKAYDLIGYSYINNNPEKIIVLKEMHT